MTTLTAQKQPIILIDLTISENESGIIDLTNDNSDTTNQSTQTSTSAPSPVIVSIDVGLVNLAFCILDPDSNSIISWSIINTQINARSSVSFISSAVRRALDVITSTPLIRQRGYEVLIEQQQQGGRGRILARIQEVQIALASLTNHRFINAARVRGLCRREFPPRPNASGRRNHYQNKLDSIHYARMIMERQRFIISQNLCNAFENAAKKDDLADCLLQLYCYQREN